MPIKKKYTPPDPFEGGNWGSTEEQALAFRLMVRHGIYPVFGSAPEVGLGGGRPEISYGTTWPEAVFNLCEQVGLTETNHFHELPRR
jgi:hypothetical protein